MFDMTDGMMIEEMALPSLPACFEWRRTTGGPALVSSRLEPIAAHLFTTRHWRLGRATTDRHDADAWASVAAAAGVSAADLVRADQVHGNAAVVAARGAPRAAADIILNADPSIALAVQTADCVPLLLADRATGAVAAAHAGWRGMAARVPEIAVASLAAEFHARPADVVAVIGPSIGACCYEVGVDVRAAFGRAGFSAAQIERWFSIHTVASDANPSMEGLRRPVRPEHWFFDGWNSVREQLEAAGLLPDHIVASDLCTASHPSAFCSYRRDGAPAGRMAAVIRPRRRP
jgi:purine-nucleoside/S-methyl-5'-thioadenosine phosphorylase / adenosine deaminase